VTGTDLFTRYRILCGVRTEAEETIDDLNFSFFARQVRKLDFNVLLTVYHRDVIS
jgi:hypothetical protein